MNPLYPLCALFLLLILASALIFWLIEKLISQSQKSDELLKQQVQDLMNRLMTIKWESYQNLNLSQSDRTSPLDGDDGVGMSDENEMRRVAALLGQEYPVGEILTEMEISEYDRIELGLN